MEEQSNSQKLTGTARLDATTEAAQAIIDQRVQDRVLKTARLRALRLEREAADPAKPDDRAKTSSIRRKKSVVPRSA